MEPLKQIEVGLSPGYWLDLEKGQYIAKEVPVDNSRYISIFCRLYDDMMKETTLGEGIRSLLHCKVVVHIPKKSDFENIALCVTPICYYRLVGENVLKRTLESDEWGETEDKAKFFYNYISLWKQLRELPSHYSFDIAPSMDSPKLWQPHHLFFRFPPIYDPLKTTSVMVPGLEVNDFYHQDFFSIPFLLDVLKEIEVCKRLNKHYKAEVFFPLSQQYGSTGFSAIGSDVTLRVRWHFYPLKDGSIDAIVSSALSLEPMAKFREQVKEGKYRFKTENHEEMKQVFHYLPKPFLTVSDLLDLLAEVEEKGICVSGDYLFRYLLQYSTRPFVNMISAICSRTLSKIRQIPDFDPTISLMERELQQMQVSKVHAEIEAFILQRKKKKTIDLQKEGAESEEIKAEYYRDVTTFAGTLEKELEAFISGRKEDFCRTNFEFLRQKLVAYMSEKGWLRPDLKCTRRGVLEFLCLRGFVERSPQA